jgi:hypothetical protein
MPEHPYPPPSGRQHPRKVVEAAGTRMVETGGGRGMATTAPAWGAKCFDACYAKGSLINNGTRNGAGKPGVGPGSSPSPSTAAPACLYPADRGRPTDWLRSCHYERIDVLTLRRHSVFLTCCPERPAATPGKEGRMSLMAVAGRPSLRRVIGKFLITNGGKSQSSCLWRQESITL